MADFVQYSRTKSAIRELATPIASVSVFNVIVQSVITDNPFGCVAYMTTGRITTRLKRPGKAIPPVTEVSHTVLLLEHDPTLFDGAENMIPQIAGYRSSNLGIPA